MDLSSELEYFLTEKLPELATAERMTYDSQVELGRSIVVYGCGNLGRKLVRALKTLGQSPVAFVDGNDNLWGKTVENLPVYSPEDGARLFGRTSALVVTIWSPGKDRRFAVIRQQLIDCGFEKVIHFLPLFWKHAELLLPHYRLDLPSRMLSSAYDVRSAFELLEDATSKVEYLAQLRWMIHADSSLVPPGLPLRDTYFPKELFALHEQECFIDCGAFDGDTMKEFLKRTNSIFDRIIAYEPDPQNFEKLHNYTNSLPEAVKEKIRLEKSVLGAVPGVVRFAAMGSVTSNVTASGTISVQRETLDELLQGVVPSYIKMDIEGAEMEALEGGTEAIKSHHPKLAVCVYHIQGHLWQIPLKIRELNPDYHFYLRRYEDEFGDSVCYAVP